MPAPLGNKNGPGGRPTAAHEHANFKLLWDILTEEVDVPKLQAKINSGTYSPMDRIRLMVAQGDKDWLHRLFIRFFPEVQVIDATGRTDGLPAPERFKELASVFSRVAVELRDPAAVSDGASVTITTPLRPGVSPPLPDQPSPSVSPGDHQPPAGPPADSGSPA